MKIYTKTGDKGLTSLADGTRIEKTDIRLTAYGTVDELNAFVGVALAGLPEPFLTEIQKRLFVLGGMLATPSGKWEELWGNARLSDFLQEVEDEIDRLTAATGNEPFGGFVLPQGDRIVADLHVCRTVCRRAERETARLLPLGKCYETPFKLLNRLSDYFFLLAKSYRKKNNIPAILWKSDK